MIRVLIVDDDPFVIRVLQRALERQGYAVDSAANGEQALEQIGRAFPDLLITDISMPRMTGREFCQRICRDFPERPFPIIVMTSMTERYEREWVKEIADIQFLEKPISPKQLVGILEEHFRGADQESEG